MASTKTHKTPAKGGYDTILDQLGDQDEALRNIAKTVPAEALRPEPGRPVTLRPAGRGGGRPTRRAASSDIAALAPFPELFTLPARQLYGCIRRIDDADVLRRSHALEAEHLKRQTVLGWIEERLRGLGSPLGGPLTEPWPGYEEEQDSDYIVERLADLSPEQGAEVGAWEHYRHRRRLVMRAAKEVAGELLAQRIAETAPRRGPSEAPEPFVGYAALSTSPHARAATRSALSARTQQELLAAVDYENAGKRRKTMLRELRSVIRLTDR